VSVVFIIVTNALRDSALSCFGLSDFEQLHAHYGGGLPCRPRRYLTTFFLSLWTQSPDQTAMFLARLVCATTVQAFWRTTATFFNQRGILHRKCSDDAGSYTVNDFARCVLLLACSVNLGCAELGGDWSCFVFKRTFCIFGNRRRFQHSAGAARRLLR